MQNIIKIISENSSLFVIGILCFFGLIEVVFGYLSNSKRTKNDLLLESINTFILMVVTKPGIMSLSIIILHFTVPHLENTIQTLNFWIGLLLFLFVDDFLQYWYHRSSHEYKWLWKHHRPHHVATEMGLLVSYRESALFYVFMPNMWWLGIATFMGLGVSVAVGIVLKQVIIVSSHSLATWDSFFYKRPSLLPIIKVLERIFITPAFHHGHHAVSKIDDIGQPNGNYGNMFSFWDQLFGSAKFSHKFPKDYGLPNDPSDSWAEHIFYPIIKSKNSVSELSKDYNFEKTTTLEPSIVTLKEGNYLYCTCGYSKNQPFCDGSHHGTKFQPEKFTIKKEREYKLCNCKLCKKGPFCDNSHLIKPLKNA